MKVGNEKEILDGAMRVFSKRGYHGCSILDITREAGVSKALFYHYFKSKKDLLVIFVKNRLEDFLPLTIGMEEIKDPKRRFIFLVDFILDELKEKTDQLRFINMVYLSEDGVIAINEGMKKYEKQFARLFRQEQKLFLELGFSDPDLEATYMRSLLQGISLEYMLSPSDYPLREMRNKLLMKYNIEKINGGKV